MISGQEAGREQVPGMERESANAEHQLVLRSCGQVVEVSDAAQMAAEIAGMGDPFGLQFQHKLLHTDGAEIPTLVDAVLTSPEGSRFNSVMMRYYTLIDLLKMTAQLAVGADPSLDMKDAALRLSSEHDVMAAAGSLAAFRQTMIDLLQKAASLREETRSPVKNGHVISRAERYVAENFCDPGISLNSVAKYVGLSAAHFSTVFSQTTGRSFVNYLTSMRIERAKKLLAQTNMKLSAIAMEIGYNEPNYFSHVFRKMEGISPKEYRSRAQKNMP